MFWPALATAVSSWWLLTGLALLLAHQSGKRARAGFMLVSVLALAALILVPFNASLNTPIAAAIGFILGLIIWCWLEISYLLGYVNGPNHQPCPPQLTVWERFKGAVSTTIYHEACVVGAVACLALISVTEPNPTAFLYGECPWVDALECQTQLVFWCSGVQRTVVAISLELPDFVFENRSLECFFAHLDRNRFFCDLPDF